MGAKGLPKPHGESIPNLAPMVDIIMVLLIFFMLGASLNLATEGVLETELDDKSGPSAGDVTQINPAVRIGLEDVDGGDSCNIYVMEDSLSGNTFEDLQRFMINRRRQGADTTNPVIIGAEGDVRYKFVMSAFDACVVAGFKNVQFAVSFASGER